MPTASNDFDHALETLRHEFVLLDSELAQIEPALAAARDAGVGEMAESIRQRSAIIRQHRAQLLPALETLAQGEEKTPVISVQDELEVHQHAGQGQ
jgi:hypothetical protein